MKKILAIGLGILILFAVYVMAAQTTERPEEAEVDISNHREQY